MVTLGGLGLFQAAHMVIGKSVLIFTHVSLVHDRMVQLIRWIFSKI